MHRATESGTPGETLAAADAGETAGTPRSAPPAAFPLYALSARTPSVTRHAIAGAAKKSHPWRLSDGFWQTAELVTLALRRPYHLTGKGTMQSSMRLLVAAACLVGGVPSLAQDGTARPHLVLQEVVAGMPRGETQEVRVMTAAFKPGDKTVFHTHRSPVTVYILEGAFTLELEGRVPVTITAGQAFVEPPNVRMTGYNRSASEPLRLVIFYVSEAGTPFLDPITQ